MAFSDNKREEIILDTNIPVDHKTDSVARSGESIRSDSRGRSELEDDGRNYKSELSQILMMMKDRGSQDWSQKQIDNLRSLVAKDESLLKFHEEHNGETALHIAAEFGILQGARELIKLGAKVDATDRHVRQPLHLACLGGQEELVDLLLKKGADIEARQFQGATPLDDAVAHIAVVELLLERDAKTQVKRDDGFTPLHTAIYDGTAEIIRCLLRHDRSNIDEVESNEKLTALNLAVYLGRAELITVLLEFGARLDIRDEDGWTPWMTATQEHPDIINTLHTGLGGKITHLEVRDVWEDTPLLAATRHGKWESVATLIEIGADCTARGFNGRTPLHWACIKGHEITVKSILAKDIGQINVAANDGCTALLFASGAKSVDASYPDEDPLSDWSSEEDESMNESQPGRYREVIKILLKEGADPKARSKRRETAFHFAAARGSPGRLDSILKIADTADISAQNEDGWTALRCAFLGDQRSVAIPKLIQAGKVEKADFGAGTADGKMWIAAVEWFAENPKTHGVVDWLLKNKNRISPVPLSSEKLSSIEWAAHEQIPKALSLLISKSGSDSTVEQVKDALEYVLKVVKTTPEVSSDTEFVKVLYILINASVRSSYIETLVGETLAMISRVRQELEAQQRFEQPLAYMTTRQEKAKRVREGVKTKQTSRAFKANEDESGDNRLRQLKNLEDILRYLPVSHIHQYIRKFPPAETKPDLAYRLERTEASVTQFFQSREESGTILRYRSVKDVIVKPGPKEIMEEAVKALTNITEGEFGFPGYSFNVDTKPKFTWIDWMHNLLRTIMDNDNCSPRQYYEIKSFFSDSLAQIPDEKLPSRFMRPRTTTRTYIHAEGEHGAKEGDSHDPGINNLENPEVAGSESKDNPLHFHIPNATAIYMPFLCFSTPARQRESPQSNEGGHGSTETKSQVVLDEDTHGSPTLDEWYYHFRDDPKSLKDKVRRNQSQVVTKYLEAIREAAKSEGSSKVLRDGQKSPNGPDDCALLHVNQLWVWIIADKWLMTATSCVTDDSHNRLEKVILDLLHKQADSRGSSSQPKSATDMSKLIVEYFIGSYERAPELKSLMSIGQIFSQYLNQIGRDESLMFDDFRTRTQSWQIPGARNGQNRVRQSSDMSSPTQSQSSDTPPTVSTDEEIRDAIRRTEHLFTDIKDVRDELNILKAIVQYQKIVERGLAGEKAKDTDLLAENILGDIKEMELVAERIQLAVNTTLSLQQSEIANFQATLATTQGKTVMAFTFATVLFLPLSFLSSLFALDVASFQEAPAWVFYVIFLVSAAISLFLAFAAYHWEQLKVLIRNAFKTAKAFPVSKNNGEERGAKEAEEVTDNSGVNHRPDTGGLFHRPEGSLGRGDLNV
ncbi:hypothetical protein H9Q72_004104 [Fusarium xylarioides]|uniref:Ankyrin repeat protein n=1 Tax=Fusarium xylarioides TaxID=221167 RepID=A0A9P7HWL5_9HYPO|nr:hypothetical protein H9Q72_004104 [Fusarium xylarioides]